MYGCRIWSGRRAVEVVAIGHNLVVKVTDSLGNTSRAVLFIDGQSGWEGT